MTHLRLPTALVALVLFFFGVSLNANAQGLATGFMGKVGVKPAGGSVRFLSIDHFARDDGGKAETISGYVQNLITTKAHALMVRVRPSAEATEGPPKSTPNITALSIDGHRVRFEKAATEHLIMLGDKHQPPAFQMDGSLPVAICLSEARVNEAKGLLFEFRLMERVRGKLWSVRGPFGLAETSNALSISALEPSRLKLKLRNDTDSPVVSIRGALVDAKGSGVGGVRALVSDSYEVSVSKDGSFVLSAKAGQAIQIGAKLDLGIEAEGVLSGEYSLRLLPILKR